MHKRKRENQQCYLAWKENSLKKSFILFLCKSRDRKKHWKSHDTAMAAKPKWKKVLYEDQGVPDNYVDDSFLDEMKKNCNHLSFCPFQKFVLLQI